MISSPVTAPPLSRMAKFFYGYGSMAYGVKNVAFNTYLLWYYNYVIGAPATLVAAAIMVALVFDAISDPIVGQISDNLRTRWGRRHPLMYLSAIPAAGSFLLLWLPPEGLSNTGIFIYLVCLATAVRTFITLYEIPSSALAPELAPGYDDRTSIASYRYFFGYVGGIGMSFLALFVLLAPTAQYPVGVLNPNGYWTFGIIGAVVMFTSVMISSMGTHHRIKYLRQLPKPEKQSNPLKTLKMMGQTFSHKSFLAILVFGILKYTALGMSAALTIYFGTFFWGFNNVQLAILSLDSLMAAGLALFLAPLASKVMGKRNAAFFLAVIAILFAAIPFVLRLNGLFFENGDPLLLPALFFITALYAMCGISSAILVHAMVGDVIDDSALRTGRRSEGLFYAANSFMQKSVSGFGVMAAGLLLAFVKFPEGARPGEVPQETINALAMWYIPAIATLYIVGASFLYFYRLNRASHEANLAEVARQDRKAGAHPANTEAATSTGVADVIGTPT